MEKTWLHLFTIDDSRFTLLLVPISDPTPRKIIRRHFDLDAVAGENADKVFAHLAADLRQHNVLTVIQSNSKEGVGQFVYHDALGWDQIIFSQTDSPLVKSSAPAREREEVALPEVGESV